MMIEKTRSTGISIISYFEMWVGGIMTLCFYIVTLLNIIFFSPEKPANYTKMFWDEGILACLFCSVISSLILLAGVFTFSLHKAGRILNLFLSGFCIFIYIIWALIAPNFIENLLEYLLEYLFTPAWLVTNVPIILSISFLIFFNNPNLKEQFK